MCLLPQRLVLRLAGGLGTSGVCVLHTGIANVTAVSLRYFFIAEGILSVLLS